MAHDGYDKNELYIGEGVSIEGKIETGGRIQIHGHLKGEIKASEVKIGPQGIVIGFIKADRLDISGSASNHIDVRETLVVRKTGCVEGDVSYGSIQIDAGASIFGDVRQVIEAEKSTDTRLEDKATGVEEGVQSVEHVSG